MNEPIIGGLYLTKENSYIIPFKCDDLICEYVEVNTFNTINGPKILKSTMTIPVQQYHYDYIKYDDFYLLNYGYCGKVRQELVDTFISHQYQGSKKIIKKIIENILKGH